MVDRARWLLAGALAAALLAVVSSPASARADVLNLTVSSRPVGRAIPADFLGLALELGTVRQWTASGTQTPDDILPTLIRNIAPTGRPSLRIGGQSAERSWWPVRGMKRPIGVTQNLNAGWIRAARTLVSTTDAKLLLGINLEAGSVRVSQVEADALVHGIGAANIRALELGNEPDLYRGIPWYRVQDDHILPWNAKTGGPEYARPPGWGPSAYAAQVASFAPQLPPLPLAGPDTAAGPWTSAFAGLRQLPVRMLTSHAYGLNQCVTDPAAPAYPSIAHLLSLYASRKMYDGVPAALALARHDGMSYRIDEMGSVTCNGRRGVSNTFASALWAMDALFDAARLGVDGVNLHTYPGSANGLFDLTYERSTHRWRASIHPLYDGVLMFAQAAPTGSRLLHLVSPAQTVLRAWATRGAAGRLRVLLVNDGTDAADVRVHAPTGYGSQIGSVERLRAPNAAATSGVRIGGHPFASTLTGVVPSPDLPALAPRRGVFVLTVPAESAVLLTVPVA